MELCEKLATFLGHNFKKKELLISSPLCLKAKEYLKQAGFADGAGLPEFVFDLRSNDTLGRQIGEFFQNEMKKKGVCEYR